MTDFKTLHRRAREEGAEWYQIFLAEKMTLQAAGSAPEVSLGSEELFPFFLRLFQENAAGHLRIELSREDRKILKAYPDFFNDSSPFVLTGEGRYLYTRRRKKQEDLFISLLESLIDNRPDPLIGDGDCLGRILAEAAQREERPLTDKAVQAFKGVNREGFFIITGGPGTGKTTIVADLIDVFEEAARESDREELKILLGAPTGRAAKRVEEGVAREGETAHTLHKLLRINAVTGEPGYHKTNPLPADLVIVDEASMIDLRLMTLLFDALSVNSHLLLVGDKDQLPSVEAGALLSDFLDGADRSGHRLKERVLHLEKVYRSKGEIITLARHVIKGEEEEVRRRLKLSEKPQPGDQPWGGQIVSRPLPARADRLYRNISHAYGEKLPGRKAFNISPGEWETCRDQIEAWFALYSDLVVLTPARKGLYGVERLNSEIGSRIFSGTKHGMPLMITRNDYDLNLFNGDRGVIFHFRGEPHAFFTVPGGYRHFPLVYLSDWEPCWVQTIHKSQGSEFEEVILILPSGAERLLTREILYTGLTRARSRIELIWDKEALSACLREGVFRNSRIREVLSADPLPV